ncbi:unnamed protein product, partial [Mesorhabditis belari]|uniref:Uncharacterized protein n=1 Tax=Mesorhabditis belari TaxID=2138241 RepID=A0AAF3EFT2_9BILA
MKFYVFLPFLFFHLSDACPPGTGQSPMIAVTVTQLPLDWATAGGTTGGSNLITIQNDLRMAVQNAARRAFPFGTQNSYSRSVGTPSLNNPQTFVCVQSPSTGTTVGTCTFMTGNTQIITQTCVAATQTGGTIGPCANSWKIQFMLSNISPPTLQVQINQFEQLMAQEIQTLKGISSVIVDAGDITDWTGGLFPYG